jgi:aminoglycoside 3-N-acetyltransferase
MNVLRDETLASVVRDIVRVLKSITPETSKNRLKRSLQRLRFHNEKLFVSADKTELRRALGKLGIRAGDIVFVHSSFDQMRSVRATPTEITEILCDSVGESGTLAMPTFPMTGTSQEYLERNQVFDWRRTPSRTGILTEIFRRMPGTERSLHPTHPVAVRGVLAKWLTEGHESSLSPFDEHSPFYKLLSCDTLVLRIGTFEAMTFRHLADHLIQDKIGHPIYNEGVTQVRAVGKDKKECIVLTKTHNPSLSCNHEIVLKRMAREGLVRTTKVGRVPLALVKLSDYIESYRCYQTQGLLLYRLKAESRSPIPTHQPINHEYR